MFFSTKFVIFPEVTEVTEVTKVGGIRVFGCDLAFRVVAEGCREMSCIEGFCCFLSFLCLLTGFIIFR